MKILACLFVAAMALAWPDMLLAQEGFSVLDDLSLDDVVEVPAPVSDWVAIGGPIALGAFYFVLMLLLWKTVPFQNSRESLNLHYYPTGIKRGLAMAITLYAIAFAFGAAEISYQLHLQGSAEEYFAAMSLGKLIAFTHAHLFGFTTSFLVIGVPFSLQFNHLWPYQWIFPMGLAAALVDVMSWWGIKYLSPNFEVISMLCGIIFSLTYLYMLIGLWRVLLFPEVVWRTDKDGEERLAALHETEPESRD
ncbi:MAG: hypothetical protein ACSHXK_04215 [Oceanococcus sp.]